MSLSITTERYVEDGLSISQYILEVDDDQAQINEMLGDDTESDAVVVVQVLEGEIESQFDVPLERQETKRQQDAYFVGSVVGQATIQMNFLSKGHARIRVLIARIRRFFAIAGKKLPCKLCKLAISVILHAVLISLGVPPLPSGDYDVSGYASHFQKIFSDIANGAYGVALQSIQSILPNKWWITILGILKALNWIFDATDAFYQDVCHALGLCPPRPLPTNP